MLRYEDVHTIRELVAESAKTHEDKDFLRYYEDGKVKSVTFRRFKEETDAVAAWTLQQNKRLGRSVRVAMLSPNSPLYLKMLLGVMCGGGVSVPMDPQMDQNTLCNCINKAEVDILIYDKMLNFDKESIFAACPQVYSIFHMTDEQDKDCQDIIEENKGQSLEPVISEKDCAIIIFTSGTTGEEKGVMLSHGNLVDSAFNVEHKSAVQINILPFHHAFGLNADVILALVIASTTCFNLGMDKLGESLQLYQPTSLNMVPMIAQALYTKIFLLSQQTGKTLEECKELVFGKNITQIITGGAHLPAELVEKYHAIGIFICQGYGMTECSPTISTPIMNRPDKAHTAGHIVKRCVSRIVDEELQVKSPSVMMGYVNAPELTAQIITEDGWLRTGDIGFEDEEGFIHITGRKKNLIILSNGENVSPEQIENRLLDHQLVEECLVYGEGKQIVAEIYPNDNYARIHHITDVVGTLECIVKEVNEQLPSYKKIMKHMIRKNPLLKTSTNKIIRNQRAAAEDLLRAETVQFSLPANEMQKKLYDIFADIMGHQEFGVDTDLFAAGLDSLGCILALTALSEKLDFNIELNELMSEGTIEKLEALYIKKNAMQKIDYSVREIYPLTNVQKYFAYVMRGNTTANVPFLFKLDNSIDLQRLKTAAEALFEVHPILKGVIQMYEDKGYALYRNDALKIDIPVYVLNAEQWQQTKAGLVKPFMYGQGEPLYHIAIYETEGEKYLFMDTAHIISDGMTAGILLRDLNKLYNGEEAVKEAYTFYEYILDDQYRAENGLRLENELYFQKLMDGMRIDRAILNKKNNGDLTVEKNAAIHASFEKLDIKQVKAFCHGNGISRNILFLTAFNYCISLFSDEDDVISTSIHNGRTDSRWGAIAGALFTTYNFRYQLDKTQSITQMLEGSAKQVMETMCCHVNNLHADEMFIQYQGDLFSDLEVGSKPAENVAIQLDSLPFHLMIHLTKTGFTYELRYWENRFEEQQLRIFMEVFEAIAYGITKADSVKELRAYIPKQYLVEERSITLGQAVHTVTVKNRYGQVQPVGGWGSLLIDGKDSGKTARLLTDGTVDYLEDSGRCIMQETLTGRCFVNLGDIEKELKAVEGVTDARAYISYGADNKLVLVRELTTDAKTDAAELKKGLTERCAAAPQPSKWIVNGIEIA